MHVVHNNIVHVLRLGLILRGHFTVISLLKWHRWENKYLASSEGWHLVRGILETIIYYDLSLYSIPNVSRYQHVLGGLMLIVHTEDQEPGGVERGRALLKPSLSVPRVIR